jgi:hypothetical protein
VNRSAHRTQTRGALRATCRCIPPPDCAIGRPSNQGGQPEAKHAGATAAHVLQLSFTPSRLKRPCSSRHRPDCHRMSQWSECACVCVQNRSYPGSSEDNLGSKAASGLANASIPPGPQPNGTCRRDNVASHLAIWSTRRIKGSRHATAPDIIRKIVVMRNTSTVAPVKQSPNRSGRRSNRPCRGAASDSWPVVSDAIDTRRLLEPLPRFTPSRSSAMRTGPLSSALSTIN